MGFRLVRSAGSVQDPVAVNMQASGTIYANSVVIRDGATGMVATAASTGMTTTNIVGIALDYVQGASDVETRVIPFVPGQVWEADTVNAVTTANVGIRHTLSDSLRVRNITNLYETASTGIFYAFAITGSTSGSGRILGTFLQTTPFRAGMTDNLG